MAKTKRKSTKKQFAEDQRISNLLIELQTATREVLEKDYQIDPTQVTEFLNQVREKFKLNAPHRPVFCSQDRRLGMIAVRYGAIAVEILKEKFSGIDALIWYDQWIARAKANRKAPN